MPAARTFALLLACLLLGLLVPARAWAARPELTVTQLGVPTRCAISADVSSPETGVTVNGAGFAPRQAFTVYLKPVVMAKTATDRSGRFSVRIKLEPGTSGTQTLQIEGAGCAVEISFAVHGPDSIVNPPPVPRPSPAPAQIPSGGNDGLPRGLTYALVALVAGAGILLFLLVSRAGRRPAV